MLDQPSALGLSQQQGGEGGGGGGEERGARKEEYGPALTNDAAVSALQRGCGAGDGPIGAILGCDTGADGGQGGAGAAGWRRGCAAGQRGAGADALRHR